MRHLPAALVLFSLVVMASHGAETAPSEEERLTRVNAAIEQIEAWMTEAGENQSALETALREADRSIETTTAASRENEAKIAALETSLAALDQRSARLTEDIADQERLAGSAIRASYMSGRSDHLKLLLNQEDPELASRMLQYFDYFNRARAGQIQEYAKTVQALARSREEAREGRSELERRSAELTEQLARLETHRQQRRELLEQLEADMAARSGELEQLIRDRQRLEDLLLEIEQAVADIPAPANGLPFAEARGRLPWPAQGPLLNSFGAAYSDGNLHRQGVIIGAETGAPVHAIHQGRVVFAEWMRGSGLLMIIDHGDGYLSLYAQNQDLLKTRGDWVEGGEAIATAGGGGSDARAGLYFEIRHNGRAQDPVNWCD